MIAPRQAMKVRLRNHACIKFQMRRRRDVIFEPVIKMDGHAAGKVRPKVRRELQVVSGPPAIPDERCRNQEHRADPSSRCLLRQDFD